MKKVVILSLCVLLLFPFSLQGQVKAEEVQEQPIETQKNESSALETAVEQKDTISEQANLKEANVSVPKKTQEKEPAKPNVKSEIKEDAAAKPKAEQKPETKEVNNDYLIPDVEFRKVVNKSLGKLGGYSATKEELASIKFLNVQGTRTKQLKINSFEGLEYLTGLETLQVTYLTTAADFLTQIGKLSSLQDLKLNTVFFTGTDDILTTSSGERVEIQQDVDFSPIGNAMTLKSLSLTFINTRTANYQSYNRLRAGLTGLGKLSNLEKLTIGQMGDLDDPSAAWLKNLTKLTSFSATDTALSSVAGLKNLPNLEFLNVSDNAIRDYSAVAGKGYFRNTSSNNYILDTQFMYDDPTKGDNLVTIKDIIKVGEVGLSSVTVQKFTAFQNYDFVSAKQSEVGSLDVTLKMTSLANVNVYNWKTGENDIKIRGTAVPFVVTLGNGKTISAYGVMPVGTVITYDENYEGGAKHTRNYDPYAKIENIEPNIRPGYAFDGWYVDKEGTTPFDFSQDVALNKTLYAKWRTSYASVEAKDSEIYEGDSWSPQDNFISATDQDGNEVPNFDSVKVTGQVDTTTPGTYEITYSVADASKTITVTVKPDQSAVHVKDSVLYVGDTWNAEDNFESTADKDGKLDPVFSPEKIKVSGSVDTTKSGEYRVTYSANGRSATAVITVKDDLTEVNAHDSEIYVGDLWAAADNFDGALDKDGKEVSFAEVTVTGEVDTTTAGVYPVVYSFDGVQVEVNVTVKPKEAAVLPSKPADPSKPQPEKNGTVKEKPVKQAPQYTVTQTKPTKAARNKGKMPSTGDMLWDTILYGSIGLALVLLALRILLQVRVRKEK